MDGDVDGDDGDDVDNMVSCCVGVDDVDGVDNVTRPNCDLGSSCELFMLFCGMNVKQLTFD